MNTISPNILDQFFRYVSPEIFNRRMLARQRYSSVSRYLEAGSKRPRMAKKFSHARTNLNEDIVAFLEIVRQRAEYLDDNMPYARRASSIWTHFVVGNGIRPDFRMSSKAKTKKIDALWDTWAGSTECDFYGQMNLYGIMALAMRTQFVSGSCFVIRKWDKTKEIPVTLQLVGPEKLDHSITANGRRKIVSGIEVDSAGRAVAYWFKTEDDSAETGAYAAKPIRFKAADVLHIYEVLRPGQITGIPRLTPCIVRISEYDDYTDAALVKQKIAACMVGAVHDMTAPDDFAGETRQEDYSEFPDKFTPGMWTILPTGKTVSFNNPPTTEGVGEYESTQLRAIASGADLPYEMLSNDYSKMNFSSSRMSLGSFYQIAEPLRKNQFIPQLCEGVMRWFLEASSLRGYEWKPEFIWTEMVKVYPDPYKEAAAAKINVTELGIESRSALIRAKGQDPETVFEQIAEETQLKKGANDSRAKSEK